MSKIIVNPYATIQIINYYSLQCISYEVHLPPGVLKHVKKQGHWEDFITYHQDLPNMISNPGNAG